MLEERKKRVCTRVCVCKCVSVCGDLLIFSVFKSFFIIITVYQINPLELNSMGLMQKSLAQTELFSRMSDLRKHSHSHSVFLYLQTSETNGKAPI